MLTEIESKELERFIAAAPNEIENDVVQWLFSDGLLDGSEYWSEPEAWNMPLPAVALPKSLIISEKGIEALTEFSKEHENKQKHLIEQRTKERKEKVFQVFITFLAPVASLIVAYLTGLVGLLCKYFKQFLNGFQS